MQEASKINWTISGNENGFPGNEALQIGCLQRIANNVEKMAQNYRDLEANYDRMKENRDMWQRWYETEKRRNQTLRGHITRLKKKLNQ